MQKEISTTEFFRCPEFTLISTLVYLGFSIEALEPDPKIPGKIIAIFRRREELDKTLELFWSRQIKVEPISYWETVREVKGRIRSVTEQSNY